MALPEFPMEVDPVLGRLQGSRRQIAVVLATLDAALNQTRFLKDFHVLGDCRRAHLEWFSELANGRRTLGQTAQDGPSRTVGKSEKNLVEIAACLLHDDSIVN